MAPKRRETRSKKSAAAAKSKHELDDDDIGDDFELNSQPKKQPRGRPPKKKLSSLSSQSRTTCQLKRYTAIEKAASSDKALEHVDNNKDMSSNTPLANQDIEMSTMTFIDLENTETDDLEFDIYPKRKFSLDGDEIEEKFDVKRSKLNSTPQNDNDDDASEKGSLDSNEMNQASPSATAKNGDDNGSIEPNEHDNDAIETELANPSMIDTEVASRDGDESPEAEHVAAANNDECTGNGSPRAEHFDSKPGDTECNESASPDGEQVDADDYDLELHAEEDFDDLVLSGEEEDNQATSSSRKKPDNQADKSQSDGLSSKFTAPSPNLRRIQVTCTAQAATRTVQMNRIVHNASDERQEINAKPSQFKIPKLRPSIQSEPPKVSSAADTPNVASRDPRVRSTPQTKPAAIPIQSNMRIMALTASSAISKNSFGQRPKASVKDRLGNRFRLNDVNLATNRTSMAFNSDSGFDPKSVDRPIDAPLFASINKAHSQTNDETEQTDEPAPDSQSSDGIPEATESDQGATPSLSPPPPPPLPPVEQPPSIPSLLLNRFASKRSIELKMPSFANGPQKYEPVFSYLFARTCRWFMHNAQCQVQPCPLQHTLPDHDFFSSSLKKMFQHSVIELWDEYMCRNENLFEFYFIDFCDYFGERSLDNQLKKMVDDCIERKMELHFMKIVNGLTLTGKSYTKAIAVVIEAVTQRRTRTAREILKLILNPRNENIRPFIDVLKSISKQPNFRFQREWVNRLLQIHKDKEDEGLANVIWSIVSDNSDNIEHDYDAELLRHFMEHVKKNTSIA